MPKAEGDGPKTAPISEFWLTALRNHIGISELITDRDAGALKHLIDVRLSYLESAEKPGFKLSFIFEPNEYFENEVLEKTYIYQSEIDYSGDFMYDRAIGTEIKWKEEKDLTKEFEIKKQRNKSACFLPVSCLLCFNISHFVMQTLTAHVSFARRTPPTRSSTSSTRLSHRQRTRSKTRRWMRRNLMTSKHVLSSTIRLGKTSRNAYVSVVLPFLHNRC